MRNGLRPESMRVYAWVAVLFLAPNCDNPSEPVPPRSAWVAQESGTLEWLWDVCFVDSSIGTVVGRAGTILQTTDGGAHWLSQPSGTDAFLMGVAFARPDTGFAVGGGGNALTILRTTTGGESWTTQFAFPAGLDYYLRDVCVLAPGIAVAVGDRGTVLRTTDGGDSWATQPSGTVNSLIAVSFCDAVTGIAVGANGTILKTVDGGISWAPEDAGIGEAYLFGVFVVDSNIATAVGTSGAILRTEDGGAKWTIQVGHSVAEHRGVYFFTRDHGFVVGGGNILETTDGGSTWTKTIVTGGGGSGYFAISFGDATHGTVVGQQGSIRRTTTGGR